MKRITTLFATVCVLIVPVLQIHSQIPPSRWTNSLGMVFVPVPETTVRFCIWDTRNQDYKVFVEEGQWGRVWPQKPPFEQGPTHPVVNVGWGDAKDFCIWLTQREQKMGLISSNQVYRLPSDREWSYAAGLKLESGDTAEKRESNHYLSPATKIQKIPGNYAGDSDGFKYTSPVGSFPPNALGIYDLSGNVWEWCMDFADDGRRHILRGDSWADAQNSLYDRDFTLPNNLIGDVGFRCVLVDAPSSL